MGEWFTLVDPDFDPGDDYRSPEPGVLGFIFAKAETALKYAAHMNGHRMPSYLYPNKVLVVPYDGPL
jgi:hypothetical protein